MVYYLSGRNHYLPPSPVRRWVCDWVCVFRASSRMQVHYCCKHSLPSPLTIFGARLSRCRCASPQ